jgi:hypothetical protein
VLKDKIAKAGVLDLFFRDGGLSGFRVTDDGVSLEHYLFEIVGPEISPLRLLKGLMNRKGFADGIFRTLETGLRNSSSFRSRFVDQASAQSISPITAYLLLGGFLRYFGVTDDVRFVMDQERRLFLRVAFAGRQVFLVDLNDGHHGFLRDARPLLKPTKESLKCYRIYQEHDIAVPLIVRADATMVYAERLAGILAPVLFKDPDALRRLVLAQHARSAQEVQSQKPDAVSSHDVMCTATGGEVSVFSLWHFERLRRLNRELETGT